MTTTAALLVRLHALGIDVVRLGPNRLRVLDPQRTITAELRAELTAHKAEILAYLAPHPCVGCGRFLFPALGVLCYWCRRRRGSGPARYEPTSA